MEESNRNHLISSTSSLVRHASPVLSPTRTLRLTEAERSSRERQGRLSIESITDRPRSNPRSRTPRRFESPLNPEEFRVLAEDDASASHRHEARRITIRPLAGTAIGTAVSTRVSWRWYRLDGTLWPFFSYSDMRTYTRFERIDQKHQSQESKGPRIAKFVGGTMSILSIWPPRLHLRREAKQQKFS